MKILWWFGECEGCTKYIRDPKSEFEEKEGLVEKSLSCALRDKCAAKRNERNKKKEINYIESIERRTFDMNCPECNKVTKVIDSRRADHEVHRKRECLSCGFQFFTTEVQTDSEGINKCYRSMRPKKKNKSDLAAEQGDQAESSRIRKLVLALEKMILDTRVEKCVGRTKQIDLPDIYPSNEIFIAEVTNAMKYRIPLIVADEVASLYRPIMKFMQADIKIIGIKSIARKINRDAVIGMGTERKTLFGSSTVIKGTGVDMEAAKKVLRDINIVGFE